jgi:hypothetical protein
MRDVERERLQHLERAEGFRHLPKGDRSHGSSVRIDPASANANMKRREENACGSA